MLTLRSVTEKMYNTKAIIFYSDISAYTKPLIVLRNGYGDIVRFTRLHQFADASANKVFVPITSSGKERLYHICSMLNYIIIEKYGQFGIDHTFHITREPLNSFFQSYATDPDDKGNFRNQVAVEKCINNCIDFFRKLKQRYGEGVVLNLNELYSEQAALGRNGRRIVKRVPLIQVRGVVKRHETFNDLPTKAFEILLTLAFRYAPDIAFVFCLQAFAGIGRRCIVRHIGKRD